MMKQFFAMKAQHPEAVLLFRCGDFYETYGDDALVASKVLGIVLTKRSSATPGAIPMAGFPHHSLETYLPKLVRAGYKVAVCDQLEDPKLAKGIVKRGITELVTPGVAFSEQLLEQKEHNYIAGLTFGKDKCGAAFLDVSTGSFHVAEGSLDYIGTLLSSFAPKELLVPRGYEKGTKERYGDHYYVSTLDEWAFVYDNAVEKLKRQLQVDSLKGFAVDAFPLAVTSAGALLVYLEQTQHKELSNICSISRIDEDSFVWMDRFTFRNLEIFASTAGKEGTSLVEVMDRCSSPMGARMMRTWLSMPVMDMSELDDRHSVVQHFVDNQDDLARLQTMLGEIGDMERIVSRAAAGKKFEKIPFQKSDFKLYLKQITKRSKTMNFLEIAQNRQSCRSYDENRAVEPEKLEKVLEAARLAPSACNGQPYHLTVCKGETAKTVAAGTMGMGMNKFTADVPVMIVISEEANLEDKIKNITKECTITVIGNVVERSSKNDKGRCGEKRFCSYHHDAFWLVVRNGHCGLFRLSCVVS